MSKAKDTVKSRFSKHVLKLYRKRDRDRILAGVESLANDVNTQRTYSTP
ncbi:MAG: hypothetical protein GY835_02755 [bacterium]|nr:hypothetical protein [bacterium]